MTTELLHGDLLPAVQPALHAAPDRRRPFERAVPRPDRLPALLHRLRQRSCPTCRGGTTSSTTATASNPDRANAAPQPHQHHLLRNPPRADSNAIQRAPTHHIPNRSPPLIAPRHRHPSTRTATTAPGRPAGGFVRPGGSSSHHETLPRFAVDLDRLAQEQRRPLRPSRSSKTCAPAASRRPPHRECAACPGGSTSWHGTAAGVVRTGDSARRAAHRLAAHRQLRHLRPAVAGAASGGGSGSRGRSQFREAVKPPRTGSGRSVRAAERGGRCPRAGWRDAGQRRPVGPGFYRRCSWSWGMAGLLSVVVR
ncbi:hypothetical protein STENM223S_09205 [Streptomyces tendae]